MAWFVHRIAADGPGPGLGFRHYTGLVWPPGARVIRSANSHGGFHGDGEYFLVVEVDDAIIKEWLAGRAPWGEWTQGPVPGSIGTYTRFGGPGVSYGGPMNGRQQYHGDEELVQLLGSDQVWYAARERGDDHLRWHNGDLLIIDGRSRRVWLSAWDF